MNTVSIMAHQDDEMRCLGTMLRCRNRGDTLAFITLTDGAKGFVQQPDIDPVDAKQIRDREMGQLADELGASYIDLGYPDEFLLDSSQVRLDLIEAIRRCRTELIFTHYSEDYNRDHEITTSLVRHCAMQACLPVIATTSPPLAAHPAVFMTVPHGPFVFPASHFVDITDVWDRKVELLKLHASQEEAMQLGVGSGLEALCRTTDAYWGDLVGCAYAEPFAPMRGRGAIKPYPVLP